MRRRVARRAIAAAESGGEEADGGERYGRELLSKPNKPASGRLSPLPLKPVMQIPVPTPRPPSMSPGLGFDAEHFNLNLTILRTPKPDHPKSEFSVITISDLRNQVSAALDSLRRDIDCAFSAVFKEMDASSARLSKRLKIQSQTATDLAEEAETEVKKMSVRISEDLDDVQATCAELVAESQTSSNRILKSSIPELMDTVEKRLECLRSRYRHL